MLALIGGTSSMRGGDFDSDAFADNSVEALHNDQVRKALSEPITEQAIDRGPDALINVRPLLAGAVEGVLDSPPFQAAFKKGVRKAHRAVFDKDRERIALTIGDANVLVADAVSSVSPKTGRKIPRDLGDRLVRVTESDSLLSVVRASERVRFLGIVLPILAVLCLAGAVAIAADRRRAVLNAAIALAAASAVGFLALLIGRDRCSQFEDPTVRDASRRSGTRSWGGSRFGSWSPGCLGRGRRERRDGRERDPVARPGGSGTPSPASPHRPRRAGGRSRSAPPGCRSCSSPGRRSRSPPCCSAPTPCSSRRVSCSA
jgi:hypothetical protein